MITFENQNFLEPSIVKKLLESGIDMSDSRYVILEKEDGNLWVEERKLCPNGLPTYTLPELLYKLPEYVEHYGALEFLKDAPFYGFYFSGTGSNPKEFEIYTEYPIVSAALMLYHCRVSEDLWYVHDISGKQ